MHGGFCVSLPGAFGFFAESRLFRIVGFDPFAFRLAGSGIGGLRFEPSVGVAKVADRPGRRSTCRVARWAAMPFYRRSHISCSNGTMVGRSRPKSVRRCAISSGPVNSRSRLGALGVAYPPPAAKSSARRRQPCSPARVASVLHGAAESQRQPLKINRKIPQHTQHTWKVEMPLSF